VQFVSARDHVDKVGILGATFAALCCLGISAVLSVVSAIGLGFLIHDAVLLPLLIISLLVTVWGLLSGWRRHHQPSALIVGVIAALSLLVFSFVYQSRLLALISIAALVAASGMNVILLRKVHDR
jgi:mercuric ion transport protein